jgi:cytochrome P450
MSVQYEPFFPAIRDDPYPHYAALREEAPVYFAEEAQAFCISRYDDARAVLLDPARFSSDAMRTMLMGIRPGLDPMTDPAAMQRMRAFAQVLPFPMEALISARNVISEDPPRHGSLRSLVNRGFTPRRITAWEPRLRAVAAECMAKLRECSTLDVVRDLAIPLPLQIITEMLGVASDRRADFKLWSDGVVAGSTGSGRRLDPVASGYAAAMQAICGYVTEVAAERRRAPSDDLVSVLLNAQDDEVALTDAELAFFVLLLLIAGNETTTNLIGNATHALLRHPPVTIQTRREAGWIDARRPAHASALLCRKDLPSGVRLRAPLWRPQSSKARLRGNLAGGRERRCPVLGLPARVSLQPARSNREIPRATWSA